MIAFQGQVFHAAVQQHLPDLLEQFIIFLFVDQIAPVCIDQVYAGIVFCIALGQ